MRLLFTWLILLTAGASAADKSRWVEIRSPNFLVVSNGGERPARRIAGQFEQIRAVFKTSLKMKVDPGKPFIVLAVKDEKSMRELLPEYWETKGQVHPAGVFFAGIEKHYVILRLDTEGDNPFHVVYHEYVHMLVDLNFRQLPLWLNEGLAEFFGNSVLGEKEIGLGRPSVSSLRILNSTKLMPLPLLLTVDHASPFYNESEKANVFYAESWALVHYLQLGSRDRRGMLDAYFRFLRDDGDPVQSAEKAFGDLRALARELESYAAQPAFSYAKLKPPAEVQEETLPARELSAAESDVAQADFLMQARHVKEARALIEEALRLEPKLAGAHEAMGLFHFRSRQRAEAAREFSQAADLDSRNFLTHYYRAVLGNQDEAEESSRETALRRSIELNPNFAPAQDALAGLLVRTNRNKEEALKLITRAVQLEPGVSNHWLNLGQVLLALNRLDDARRLAEKLFAEAHTTEEKWRAETMRNDVKEYEREIGRAHV